MSVSSDSSITERPATAPALGGKPAAAAELAPPRITPTDGELLTLFARQDDRAALERLIERHAAMVWRVCRTTLRRAQDAEDAFQATFLLLVKNARSIQSSDSAAGWLYRVAYRTSLRARKKQAARREESLALDPHAPGEAAFPDLLRRQTTGVLVEELMRLPAKYQTPLVMRYLEGQSRRQIADQTDTTIASVQGRLARGKQMLRHRLLRRGVSLSSAMAALGLGARGAQAAETAPAHVLAGTTSHSVALASGGSLAASAAITSLFQEGARAMFLTTLAKPAATLATAAAVALMLLPNAPAREGAPIDPGLQLAIAATDPTEAASDPTVLLVAQQEPTASRRRESSERTTNEATPPTGVGGSLPDGEAASVDVQAVFQPSEPKPPADDTERLKRLLALQRQIEAVFQSRHTLLSQDSPAMASLSELDKQVRSTISKIAEKSIAADIRALREELAVLQGNEGDSNPTQLSPTANGKTASTDPEGLANQEPPTASRRRQSSEETRTEVTTPTDVVGSPSVSDAKDAQPTPLAEIEQLLKQAEQETNKLVALARQAIKMRQAEQPGVDPFTVNDGFGGVGGRGGVGGKLTGPLTKAVLELGQQQSNKAQQMHSRVQAAVESYIKKQLEGADLTADAEAIASKLRADLERITPRLAALSKLNAGASISLSQPGFAKEQYGFDPREAPKPATASRRRESSEETRTEVTPPTDVGGSPLDSQQAPPLFAEPTIIQTVPERDAKDVDPGLKEVRITFDRDMDTGGFSFTGLPQNGMPNVPDEAKPKWIDKQTCVLPVKLEPGRPYRIGINAPSFKNFRSADGQPAAIDELRFETAAVQSEPTASLRRQSEEQPTTVIEPDDGRQLRSRFQQIKRELAAAHQLREKALDLFTSRRNDLANRVLQPALPTPTWQEIQARALPGPLVRALWSRAEEKRREVAKQFRQLELRLAEGLQSSKTAAATASITELELLADFDLAVRKLLPRLKAQATEPREMEEAFAAEWRSQYSRQAYFRVAEAVTGQASFSTHALSQKQLKEFQIENDLKPTGEFDEATWNALFFSDNLSDNAPATPETTPQASRRRESSEKPADTADHEKSDPPTVVGGSPAVAGKPEYRSRVEHRDPIGGGPTGGTYNVIHKPNPLNPLGWTSVGHLAKKGRLPVLLPGDERPRPSLVYRGGGTGDWLPLHIEAEGTARHEERLSLKRDEPRLEKINGQHVQIWYRSIPAEQPSISPYALVIVRGIPEEKLAEVKAGKLEPPSAQEALERIYEVNKQNPKASRRRQSSEEPTETANSESNAPPTSVGGSPTDTGSQPASTGSLASELVAKRTPARIDYSDGKADGKKSLGGSGHLMRFELPEGAVGVKHLRLHGSRYGTAQAPREDFEISFLSEDRSEILAVERAAYGLFRRGKEKWTTIRFDKPVVDLPETFWVAVDFAPGRTKGIYLSYDTSTKAERSMTGLAQQEPGDHRPVTFGGDWMVQLITERAKAEPAAP